MTKCLMNVMPPPQASVLSSFFQASSKWSRCFNPFYFTTLHGTLLNLEITPSFSMSLSHTYLKWRKSIQSCYLPSNLQHPSALSLVLCFLTMPFHYLNNLLTFFSHSPQIWALNSGSRTALPSFTLTTTLTLGQLLLQNPPKKHSLSC